MAVNTDNRTDTDNQDVELSDIEIAELANKELKKRDQEISQLKKELARQKLYSEASEVEEDEMTREECLKACADPNSTNYDVAKCVVRLSELDEEEHKANCLGKQAAEVRQFLSDVIDACDGDKTAFANIYYNALQPDPPEIASAYKKRRINQ